MIRVNVIGLIGYRVKMRVKVVKSEVKGAKTSQHQSILVKVRVKAKGSREGKGMKKNGYRIQKQEANPYQCPDN